MKKNKRRIGDLQFWNEAVVDDRNALKEAKTWKEKVEACRKLRMSRMCLEDAEKLILTILLLGILFIAGCRTIEGLGADIHHITRPSETTKLEK